MTPIEFWRRIRLDPDGCWEWLKQHHPHGYGQLWWDRRHYLAHRLAFEFAYGAIPEGGVVHHECENKACCRPTHLKLIASNSEHVKLHGPPPLCIRQLAQTHCPHDHPYSGDNLYHHSKSGARQCRACLNATHQAQRKAS
jgi:hypothetical protein